MNIKIEIDVEPEELWRFLGLPDVMAIPEDAARYLALADEIMGKGWATPETFRFGASGLLDDVLAALEGATHEGGSAY